MISFSKTLPQGVSDINIYMCVLVHMHAYKCYLLDAWEMFTKPLRRIVHSTIHQMVHISL